MSFCTVPTVAANRAVAAPTIVTTARAVSLVSNIGERRQTMKTPAVTIVAAWIKAETGVGPAIASGNHTYSGIWALLPAQPRNTDQPTSVAAFTVTAFSGRNTCTSHDGHMLGSLACSASQSAS